MPFRNYPLDFCEVNMQARFFIVQDETLRKAFGARLKGLRKQKNCAQKELAALVGIRFQQLNKYESGLNIPPAEMLVKLADTLGVTVDLLLTGNPVEDSPLASSRLLRNFKVIDAMIAKGRMTSALTPVDAAV
jgi:transcriptional regulator with XRE-family HTH domain